VVNRLPWLGSAENNHGPNWSLPDLTLHAWMLACHKSVLVGPNVKRRTVLVLVGPITSPDAARSIVRAPPIQVPQLKRRELTAAGASIGGQAAQQQDLLGAMQVGPGPPVADAGREQVALDTHGPFGVAQQLDDLPDRDM